MIGKLAYFRERLNTSIWLIPIGLCALGAAGAAGMLWVDRHVDSVGLGFSDFAMTQSSASQVLSVIAGSIIGVGGVAFSVTMVALTLTSGQYGPKILRNLLEDNASKLSLGLFLGTYVYALIVLASYTHSDRPRFTVIIGILLAFIALIGFVRFIHQMATDLQADKIVQRIGGNLQQALLDLAAHADSTNRASDTLHWRRAARQYRPYPVASTAQGYVQTIDYAGLVRWCSDNGCLLQVRARAGDFIVEGVCLFKVYGGDPERLEASISDLNGHIVVGPMRTPIQDPAYAITQLNQLAARALSPGINDPGTAITSIDWFSLALAKIVDRDIPGCVLMDDEQQPLLLARTTHFPGIAKEIYAPLRQFSKADIAVTVCLIESLCRLAELTQRADRLEVLALHGQSIWQEVSKGATLSYDLRDIRQRYKKLMILTKRVARTDRLYGSPTC